MRESGCWSLSIAPESGDPMILKKIRKQFTLDQVRQVVKWCRELGILLHTNFMIGFPWETEDSVKRTIDFAMELDTEIVNFGRVFPLPGTDIYKYLKKNDLLIKELDSSDYGYYDKSPHFKLDHIDSCRLDALVKKAHRRFYFRPRKLWQISNALPLSNIVMMFRYAMSKKIIAP